jgi:hypothetical protein
VATAFDLFKATSEFTNKKEAVSLPDTLFINGIPTSDPSKIINGCAGDLFPKAMISSTNHELGGGCCRCCNLLFKYLGQQLDMIA